MTSGPRDRVIDATLKLAAERDFGDVTITDIAHAAGISLADFRDLFPSKGAILGGFNRRIDRQVLEEIGDHSSPDAARDRLYYVLRKRLEALEPHRDALASVARWAARDPLMATALNRETVNSMRFMLEAAEIESDGPVGALKLQGLAFAWGRVLDAWFKGDFSDALDVLDRELTKGESHVERAEDIARMTKPLHDMAARILDWRNWRKDHAASEDEFPHHHA